MTFGPHFVLTPDGEFYSSAIGERQARDIIASWGRLHGMRRPCRCERCVRRRRYRASHKGCKR